MGMGEKFDPKESDMVAYIVRQQAFELKVGRHPVGDGQGVCPLVNQG
jgi:hypothetical protein